jgi:hypothetical protein
MENTSTGNPTIIEVDQILGRWGIIEKKNILQDLCLPLQRIWGKVMNRSKSNFIREPGGLNKTPRPVYTNRSMIRQPKMEIDSICQERINEIKASISDDDET